jgi:hypothetical protein
MKKFFKSIKQNADYSENAMETETIQKKRGSKSLTSRGNLQIFLKIALISLIAISVTSCGLTSLSDNIYVPRPCTDNTDLERSFLEAIAEQNPKKVESCINAGVNINGASCSHKRVNTAAGQGMWGKMTIYESKPFFLEAIETGSAKIIKIFIDKGVEINQKYVIYEYAKDFGGHHTGNIKSALAVTTLDACFNSIIDYEILDLLLAKGAKITSNVETKAKQMADEEINKILKKYETEK